jgi:hypothetical protein
LPKVHKNDAHLAYQLRGSASEESFRITRDTTVFGRLGANLDLKRALSIEGVATIALLAMSLGSASAQTQAGDRVFLHTIFVGQPGVSDDLTLPSFSWSKASDGARVTTLSASLSKRVTENFGVVIDAPTWTHIGSSEFAPSVSGFENLTTAFKYMALQDAEHQLMMCIGLQVEWGNTGSSAIGVNSFSTITPQIYIGKGFGDLPPELGWLRPLAVTGQFGLAIPTRHTDVSVDTGEITGGPTVFDWGLTLQYNPASASDHSGFHLAPLIEASFQTPVANSLPGLNITTGSLNAGVAVGGRGVQFTTEATFPINSLSGHGVGVVASLTFSFGELAPDTLGKPLLQTARALGR